MPDVIIIGAGLAGLSAARHLTIHGAEVLLLEASDDVGGRVRSDVVDGFTLDRGFQLYNPAYPEAARVLDHQVLDLRPLVAGVIVAGSSGVTKLGDPRSRPGWAPDALRASTGSLLSKLRFASYAWGNSRRPVVEVLSEVDGSALDEFRALGLDTALIDRVLRPFLTGVFLEGDLATSRRFLDLVMRSFVRGTPALPATGMQAIPRQLRDSLPAGWVQVNTPVLQLAGTTVHTAQGALTAQAVLVATDPTPAQALVPSLTVPIGRSTTTWYHATPIWPRRPGCSALIVDGDNRGPVVSTVPLTYAVPEYAPEGVALISTSTLGLAASTDDEQAVRRHLALLYGCDTSNWDLVGHYAISYALPAMLPPLNPRQPDELGGGLFVAGDHRDTASIQGAMVSGRRAAQAILQHLKI
ncbi:MAG: NAD(P)/FAD-dependent oxidoreductase [Actinomycetales bacterium]